MKKLFVFLFCALCCVSCATLFSGTKASVNLSSNVGRTPVDLIYDGTRQNNVILPTQIEVRRGFKATTVRAEAPNYEPAEVTIKKKMNPTTLMNLVLGGIIGFTVDTATGAITKPRNDSYYFEMYPIEGNYNNYEHPTNYVERTSGYEHEKDATIVDGEARAMVGRDTYGTTALEKTIIRWFVDSEPRGARVFWRVISSVPAQVKNTNESYLGSTPFEETRSFNILGLTYENSRDVQIEIKVTKPGYTDQTKRFNVRQAIDQMEISSFYDLIPKEEM